MKGLYDSECSDRVNRPRPSRPEPPRAKPQPRRAPAPAHAGAPAHPLRLLLVCLLLAKATHAAAARDRSLTVVAAGPDGAVLAELTRAALLRAGLDVRVTPAPPECRRPPVESPDGCLNATLRVLVRGGAQVALVPQSARAPPALLLRDAGLENFGEAAPLDRLACYATSGPAHSLLDLAREDVARAYAVTNASTTSETAACAAPAGPLAALRVHDADAGDADQLARLVCEWGLRARVLPSATPAATAALYCTREPGAPAARPLGPPPCTRDYCAFEPRRLLKLVNARALAHSPTAYRLVGRLALDRAELSELRAGARTGGVERAAREFLAARPAWARPPAEVRVAVMVPAGTSREVFPAAGLRAAAELAERDLRDTGSDSDAGNAVRFKVELAADGCASTAAFKYLTDALGSEYGALSAVAGPACAAPFADVARQSPALALPVLAYTAQAPPGAAAGRLVLLAAGDARREADAWAALFARLGWRRLAVLSELGARSALEVSRLRADVVVHVELPADGEDVDTGLIAEWAERAAGAEARVLLVSAEDARVVRAALCAGSRAGLRPETGAVWLLPGALPAGWERGAADCDAEELAAGHLSVVPEWLADWELGTGERVWDQRWREACAASAGSEAANLCRRPPASAALLYDVLSLWTAAVRRLLAERPADADDLHRAGVVERLVANATAAPHSGLTGPVRWEGNARTGALVLLQRGRSAGRWVAGRLEMAEGALAWRTPDGRVPGDGGDRCALQPFADLLHADCRLAYAVAAALTLTLTVASLAGAACHCRSRAERRYRARLAELGLRDLAAKPTGLDRWEVPRDRVVINRKLGAGAFGTVYGGHALLPGGRGWTAVAVKTLKAGASTEEKLDFLSEAETMKRFEHENVVRLLAVITKTEPVCTVMEFMLFGDLKSFLLARRQLSEGSEEVSATRLTGMALDAARALSYLAQLRYVHRDVAARNCLVSAGRVLKLADFGMTRLVFENDYYRFSRKGLLPVRWMAPESLALGVFSAASDVWSFGVLLYEMVTFGALPHQGLSNAQVLARVKAGRTLSLPPGIKPQLEGLMKSCWVREPRARPSAADVAAFLAESPRLLTPCPEMPPVSLPPDADPVLAEARWGSWAAPASAATDTTYLSAEASRDTDAFLP